MKCRNPTQSIWVYDLIAHLSRFCRLHINYFESQIITSMIIYIAVIIPIVIIIVIIVSIVFIDIMVA